MWDYLRMFYTTSPKNWWVRVKIKWYAKKQDPGSFAALLGLFDNDVLSDLHLFVHEHMLVDTSAESFTDFSERLNELILFIEQGSLAIARWHHSREKRTAAAFFEYDKREMQNILLQFSVTQKRLLRLRSAVMRRTFEESDRLLLSAMGCFQADLIELLESLYI